MADTTDLDLRHPVAAAMEGVGEAIGLLAPLTDDQLWTVPDAELLRLRRDIEAHTARLASETLAITREIESRGAAMSVGAPSTTAWLMSSLRMSPGAAKRETLLADSLAGDMSATRDALASGRISAAAAAEIDRAVRVLPESVDRDVRDRGETFLLEQAEHLRPDQLARLGRHLLLAVDPDHAERLAERELDAVEERELFLTRGGALNPFRGALDAEANEKLLAVIGPLSAPRPSEDGTPDPRSPARRRADAFMHMVDIAMASGDLPTEGGEPPHVLVTVPLEALQSGAPPQTDEETSEEDLTTNLVVDESDDAQPVRAGELPDGTPVSPESARRIACDADVVAVLLGSFGQVLDFGRSTRSVPRRLRKALVARDRGCAFPGCDRPPGWCQAHHIWHWAHGGPTSLDNLVLLCGHHHRVVHHAGWTVALGENGLPRFTPPRWVDPLQVPITRPWRRALDQLPLRT